jgi:hypothetical protein
VLALPAACAAGRLPDGARFHKGLGEGHSLTVQVRSTGVSVMLSAVPVTCTQDIPRQGKEAYVGLGLSAPLHPEVGKSYKLTKTKTRSGGKGEGTSSSTTEVTLNFKSAKQVLVSIHQVSTVDGEAGCERSGTYTVKRQG